MKKEAIDEQISFCNYLLENELDVFEVRNDEFSSTGDFYAALSWHGDGTPRACEREADNVVEDYNSRMKSVCENYIKLLKEMKDEK